MKYYRIYHVYIYVPSSGSCDCSSSNFRGSRSARIRMRQTRFMLARLSIKYFQY